MCRVQLTLLTDQEDSIPLTKFHQRLVYFPPLQTALLVSTLILSSCLLPGLPSRFSVHGSLLKSCTHSYQILQYRIFVGLISNIYYHRSFSEQFLVNAFALLFFLLSKSLSYTSVTKDWLTYFVLCRSDYQDLEIRQVESIKFYFCSPCDAAAQSGPGPPHCLGF